MKSEILSSSLKETKAVGKKIGELFRKNEGVVFLALYGDLGSGKTTFLQGLAKGLGVRESVNSPTFLIYKRYQIKKDFSFYHFDAYRITEKDLKILNFSDIIQKKRAVIAVEWSENIEKELPDKKIKIVFSFVSPNERKLIVEDNSGIITDKYFSNK
jgi:tRNA threonylcarbamoyladenosine biosynthesis protein TsaE